MLQQRHCGLVQQAPDRLAAGARDEAFRHRFPIDNERPHALGVEDEMKNIARPYARDYVDERAKKVWRRLVDGQHVPMTIHDDRRERVVLAKQPTERG